MSICLWTDIRLYRLRRRRLMYRYRAKILSVSESSRDIVPTCWLLSRKPLRRSRAAFAFALCLNGPYVDINVQGENIRGWVKLPARADICQIFDSFVHEESSVNYLMVKPVVHEQIFFNDVSNFLRPCTKPANFICWCCCPLRQVVETTLLSRRRKGATKSEVKCCRYPIPLKNFPKSNRSYRALRIVK